MSLGNHTLGLLLVFSPENITVFGAGLCAVFREGSMSLKQKDLPVFGPEGMGGLAF